MEITLKNLCKYFISKDKEVVKAVDDMNLIVPSGKLVALIGPSGCGKSTTLYMIAGLYEPTHGQILFDNEDITKVSPEKRGVGLVFQNYALFPHLTVRQNIMFPLENEIGLKEDKDKLVEDIAKLVNIDTLLDRNISELSGGEKQRTAIARALIKKPKVLLLDEPFSNLDARLRLQTREEIRRIQKETGITTIFVTHDQEEAISISDEIAVMNDGIIQQIGKPIDVYDKPLNLFVAKFLGNPEINVFDGVLNNSKIYLKNNYLSDFDSKDNKDIFVAIRPEGFIVDKIEKDFSSTIEQEKGMIKAKVDQVHIIGGETTLVLRNPFKDNSFFKVTIPNDLKIEESNIVSLLIKPNKMFIFNKEGDLL